MNKFVRFYFNGTSISVNSQAVECLEDDDGSSDTVTARAVRATGSAGSSTKVYLTSGKVIVIPKSRDELERLFSVEN